MEHKKISAVIFDMDGVLVDTEPVYYKRLDEFLISRGYFSGAGN